jgi:hypothetical protein
LERGQARSKILLDTSARSGGSRVKEKPPVVKQLYRLSVEPRVVEQLAKLADRLREPRSRLATRLFTEAVMSAKSGARSKARANGNHAS